MAEHVIPGLVIARRFLEPRNQNVLIQAIDSGEWSSELKRRVQHFGYRYDYTARRISATPEAPLVPEWGKRLARQMQERGITNQQFDQLIVNEYLPGQGIAAHVDSVLCFENEIISISLGSACVMAFSHPIEGKKFAVLLEPGDLLRIKDEARHQWCHQIKPRKSDRWQGRTLPRGRRVSVTFRRVLLP